MKLDHLKEKSLLVCESLSQIPSEITHRERQLRCATFLHYAVEPGTVRLRLNRANFCKQRTCPICNWLKSTKLRVRIFRGLPRLLADYPDCRFLLLTLTIKNCHFKDLRSQVRMMEKGWNRLVNLQRFPAIGYLKTLEVARPRDCFYHGQFVERTGQTKIERWLYHFKKLPNWNPSAWREYPCEDTHPHFHALLMVNSSYSCESEYIKQAEWRSLWKRAARLDYEPFVDIRTVEALSGAILETTKYCLKPTDMVDVLGCLIVRQLHGLRLTSIGRAFNDYFSQAALDAIAATGELGTEHWQSGLPCWYEWDGEEYALTKLGASEWQLA
jgi:plasmid rolling circle replication initiator protein Rep